MRITIGNWLYNAGIVGFLRILREKGISYNDVINDGIVSLTQDMLEGFEEAYFKIALKNQYETLLTIKEQGKIRETFKEKLNANFDKIKDEYLSKLKGIEKSDITFKEYSNKVVSVVEDYFGEILKIFENSSLSKDRAIKSIQKKVEESKVKKLESIINHNVFSNYFGNFYFNKSSLCNPKGSMNRIKAFKDEYVTNAIETLETNNTDGVACRFCNQNKVNLKVKNQKDLPVFNEGLFSISGVSIDKFKNFFYNAIPDLFICSVCELILLCSFAGLNKKPYRLVTSDKTDYIFVNMPSLELLAEENDALKGFYDSFSENVKDSIYEHVLQDILLKEKRKKSKWVLQNVFFVELKTSARKDTGKPVLKYFHIGKDIAELFSSEKVIDSLRNVKGTLNLQKNMWVNIKSEAIKQLLENDSLYPLVYKNLRGILDNGKGNSYNSFVLAFVQTAKRQINIHYSKGGELMDSKQVYGILKGQFFEKGKQDFADLPLDKRERLSYRLLSLIRTGKYAEFYEAIMKLYISAGNPIPETLLGLLNTKDTIDFEAKAYAFMSGFLQDVKKPVDVTNLTAKEGAKDE